MHCINIKYINKIDKMPLNHSTESTGYESNKVESILVFPKPILSRPTNDRQSYNSKDKVAVKRLDLWGED